MLILAFRLGWHKLQIHLSMLSCNSKKCYTFLFLPFLQGPNDAPSNDESIRIFPKEMSEQERRDFIMKAYEKLKLSYERFKKPDGKKDYPARSCKDLAVAHPDYENGNPHSKCVTFLHLTLFMWIFNWSYKIIIFEKCTVNQCRI